MTTSHAEPLAVVVLISGRGSNMGSILDYANDPGSGYRVRGVISNRPDAAGLGSAVAAGVAAACVDHRQFRDRADFELALSESIDEFQPGLLALAGFMRILSPDFVARYAGRILNIHPSLLPKYRGLNTHLRALEAGERIHGASVHFVTAELDGGPVVLQAGVPVSNADDPDTLAAKVLQKEHQIYPMVISWFAMGRLQMQSGAAFWDGTKLEQPLRLEECVA
jgi:phosphoribosylglycinamide formyltransferase-1